jgi:hypothetical protein
MAKTIATEEEVLKKVLLNTIKNGDCLEYMGHLNQDGYGIIKIGGRKGKFIFVHRFIYQKTIGVIPEGLSVCHNCDNPPCCNPSHLFLGTQDDNMKDMATKGRAFRSIGEKSGLCKITKKQVENIRKDPRKNYIIAKEYGLAKSTISMIRNFKSRKYE